MNASKIGIVIINFLRPDATIKCVDSLLKVCPDIKIYLGDQDQNSKLEKHYNNNNVYWTQLPYDCGISVARNRLITQIVEDGCDYFMWADNDFVFDETFKLQDAITLLENNKKMGVVGGSVKKNRKMCHYERFMYYDRKRGILTYVPIELTHPNEKTIDGVKYFDCDITFNFAIARKEVWKDKRVRWHEPIKVKFEHSAFFLQLKRYSKYKVVYCPSMSVNHEHVGTPEYKEFRFRKTDAQRFSEFFKLKTMHEIKTIAYDFCGGGRLQTNTPKKQCFNLKETNSLKILNNNGILPVLLNNSCREAIEKIDLNMEMLNLGFANSEDLEKAKKLTNNKHKYSIWKNNTKNINVLDINLRVPFPVLNYLRGLSGKQDNK